MRRRLRRILWFFFPFLNCNGYYRAFRDAYMMFARFVFTGVACVRLVVRSNRHFCFFNELAVIHVRPAIRFFPLLFIHTIRDFCRRVHLFITGGVSTCFLPRRFQIAVSVGRVVLRLRYGSCLRAGVV